MVGGPPGRDHPASAAAASAGAAAGMRDSSSGDFPLNSEGLSI